MARCNECQYSTFNKSMVWYVWYSTRLVRQMLLVGFIENDSVMIPRRRLLQMDLGSLHAKEIEGSRRSFIYY